MDKNKLNFQGKIILSYHEKISPTISRSIILIYEVYIENKAYG